MAPTMALTDWRPAAGEKVVLTPSIGSNLLTYDVTGPNPIIVTVERVDCIVGDDGFLTKSDGRPVYIAPTDDPLLSVTGWTWTASIKGKSVVFAAPTGGVVDLAMFIAAPATNNTLVWIERIPKLIDAAGNLGSIESVARDGDDLVVTLTNGSVSRFPLPEGVPGPAPEISWIGTSLVVDDQPPVDLKGAKGDNGDPPETSWAGTSLVVDDLPPVDLKGAKGDPGNPSTYLIVGPGRPDTPATTGGIITGSEPVGAEYRSTNGAGVGAWAWMKRPTGWAVTDGDTGWRQFDELFSSRPDWNPTLAYGQTSKIQIRRQSSTVLLAFDRASFTSTGAKQAIPLPAGFKVGGRAWLTVGPVIVDDPGTSIIGKLQPWSDAGRTPEMEWKCIKANTPGSTSFTYNTDDPWPATLPGTPG